MYFLFMRPQLRDSAGSLRTKCPGNGEIREPVQRRPPTEWGKTHQTRSTGRPFPNRVLKAATKYNKMSKGREKELAKLTRARGQSQPLPKI